MASRSDQRTPAPAQTPEDLETLLEDATIMFDQDLVLELFEADGMLITIDGLAKRGRAIGRLPETFPDGYRAEPRAVLQVGDVALVLGAEAVSVIRRSERGSWRFVICDLDLKPVRKSDACAT